MTVLVFGASGQVATELGRRPGTVTLGRETCDVTRPGAVEAAIDAHHPRAVINAAAWTAVDDAERHEARAMALNAEAPGAMARACAARGLPFAHISTDYVFDGSGTAPWRDSDPVAPQNAYGRSKEAGERAVAAAGGRAVILRTSWVFSAHGANFLRTMLRLSESRDHLTIVADQVGGPTPAADIAATLLRITAALQEGAAGGTYHYAGAPAVSWAAFARAIFAAAGRSVTVEEIPSRDYPTPALRPLNSRLDGTRLEADFGIGPADWRAGLNAILKELGA